MYHGVASRAARSICIEGCVGLVSLVSKPPHANPPFLYPSRGFGVPKRVLRPEPSRPRTARDDRSREGAEARFTACSSGRPDGVQRLAGAARRRCGANESKRALTRVLGGAHRRGQRSGKHVAPRAVRLSRFLRAPRLHHRGSVRRRCYFRDLSRRRSLFMDTATGRTWIRVRGSGLLRCSSTARGSCH